MSERIRRTEIQIEDLIDQIFRLQVLGATPKQIQTQLNLPARTYFEYNQRLQDRIVGSETAKRTEEIMVQKELCRERLVKSMRGLEGIAITDGISPRTKMDAWYKFAEVCMAEFKLQTEMKNWLVAYNRLSLEEPLRLASASEASTSDIGQENAI